jgi:hypothetical protein
VISAIEEMIDVVEQDNAVVTTLKKPFELADLAAALQLALKEIEVSGGDSRDGRGTNPR